MEGNQPKYKLGGPKSRVKKVYSKLMLCLEVWREWKVEGVEGIVILHFVWMSLKLREEE